MDVPLAGNDDDLQRRRRFEARFGRGIAGFSDRFTMTPWAIVGYPGDFAEPEPQPRQRTPAHPSSGDGAASPTVHWNRPKPPTLSWCPAKCNRLTSGCVGAPHPEWWIE